MTKYFVYYFIPYEVDDEGTQVFTCWARNEDRAIELCVHAYPDCVIQSVEFLEGGYSND